MNERNNPDVLVPALASIAANIEGVLDAAHNKLNYVSYLLTRKVASALKIPGQLARKITIIRDPTVTVNAINAAAVTIPPKNDINKPSPNSDLSIIIGLYKFTLIEKIVIFDRKYVNFDVYSIPYEITRQQQLIKELTEKNLKDKLHQNKLSIGIGIDLLHNIVKILQNPDPKSTELIKIDVITSLLVLNNISVFP